MQTSLIWTFLFVFALSCKTEQFRDGTTGNPGIGGGSLADSAISQDANQTINNFDSRAVAVWDLMQECNQAATTLLESLNNNPLQPGARRTRLGRFINKECFEAYYSAISYDKLGIEQPIFGSCSYRVKDVCNRDMFLNGALGAFPEKFISLSKVRKAYIGEIAAVIRCAPVQGQPEPFIQDNNTAAPLFGSICETIYK